MYPLGRGHQLRKACKPSLRQIALALALLFVAPVSRADQLYAVNGNLTIVGNDACGGLCVETINFSFELDEYKQVDYFLSIVPGT